jgi:hypothetical protein
MSTTNTEHNTEEKVTMNPNDTTASTTSVSTSIPSSQIPTKRLKKYDQKNIAPTAQSMGIDPLNANHPVTLPFIDPYKIHRDLSSDSGGTQIKDVNNAVTAVAESKIDENSSHAVEHLQWEWRSHTAPPTATQLAFDDPNGGADQLYVIQLPSQLPINIKRDEPSTLKTSAVSQPKDVDESKSIREERSAAVTSPNEAMSSSVTGNIDATLAEVMSEREFKSVLPLIPAGTLGTLRIHRSGKVSLKIGDVLFNVTAGMPLNFLQELVAINLSNQKYYLLGEVTHRMIVSADVPSLVTALDKHHITTARMSTLQDINNTVNIKQQQQQQQQQQQIN